MKKSEFDEYVKNKLKSDDSDDIHTDPPIVNSIINEDTVITGIGIKNSIINVDIAGNKYTGTVNLHIINFTDIQLAIYENCPHDELTIIMRRYMMKIAETIAKDHDDKALITGESIGQVASQTIESLLVTNEVCTLPVFRPLIGFDKQDIVELSQQIGTYETSIEPYEDCCTIFVAKHPVTKPILENIERSEEKLEGIIEELLEKAVETKERILVKA